MTVIVKAQANINDGEKFETFHYETQASQVMVLDEGGNIVSNLEETLLNGELLDGVDLNAIKETGLFKIKGCLNTPTGLDIEETYIFKSTSIKNVSDVKIVLQEVYNHNTKEISQRYIAGEVIGEWFSSVTENAKAIEVLKKEFQVSIDEIHKIIKGDEDADGGLTLVGLKNLLDSHNHDRLYLKQSGGVITGDVSASNNVSFAGKNTSGDDLNLAKVNEKNDVVLGDSKVSTVIEALNGNVLVKSGGRLHPVYHSGNLGSGSGLDADKLDGIEGDMFARKDNTNFFTAEQNIVGANFNFRALSGSQAGCLVWRDSDGRQKGAITVDVNGNLWLHGGTLKGHAIKSDGEILSHYKHHLDATYRDAGIRLTQNSSDSGIGWVMGSSNGKFFLYDWAKGRSVYSVNRELSIVEFTNSIALNGGRKLSIQPHAPYNPSEGDIWIQI